jgi:hypothetical protein
MYHVGAHRKMYIMVAIGVTNPNTVKINAVRSRLFISFISYSILLFDILINHF